MSYIYAGHEGLWPSRPCQIPILKSCHELGNRARFTLLSIPSLLELLLVKVSVEVVHHEQPHTSAWLVSLKIFTRKYPDVGVSPTLWMTGTLIPLLV